MSKSFQGNVDDLPVLTDVVPEEELRALLPAPAADISAANIPAAAIRNTAEEDAFLYQEALAAAASRVSAVADPMIPPGGADALALKLAEEAEDEEQQEQARKKVEKASFAAAVRDIEETGDSFVWPASKILPDSVLATDDQSLTAATRAAMTSPLAATLPGYGDVKYNVPLLFAEKAAAPAPVVAAPAPGRAATTPAPAAIAPAAPAAAAPQRTPAQENAECLLALMKILEIKELKAQTLLRDFTLVKNNPDAYPKPAGRASVVVNTSGNTAVIAKGLVEFQDNSSVQPADALEGAICVLNDKASYPHGVTLQGSPRDRYMLMLAANRVGLNVKNPVDETTLSPDDKAAVQAAWYLHLAQMDPDSKTQLDALMPAPAVAAKSIAKTPLTREDRSRLSDLLSLGGKPAKPQPVKTTEPSLG